MENEVAIAWSSTDRAVVYHVEVCPDWQTSLPCDTVATTNLEATYPSEYRTWHDVRVRAWNEGGNGPWTSKVSVRTARPGVLLAGTVWMVPGLLTPDDETTYDSVYYIGRDTREWWNTEERRWIELDSLYLFNAVYGDHTMEYRLHPGWDSRESAEAHIVEYADDVGRLPGMFLTINDHFNIYEPGSDWGAAAVPWTGGILYAAKSLTESLEDGFLEEILFHEAAHNLTSQSGEGLGIENSDEWLAAQTADGIFITHYAKLHPYREDTAETAWGWFAVQCPDRLPNAVIQRIIDRLPNRLAIFDEAIPFDCPF